MFKVLGVKYSMAYHFTGPDGPINNMKIRWKNQDFEIQNTVKNLVNEGRLEFIGGGKRLLCHTQSRIADEPKIF